MATKLRVCEICHKPIHHGGIKSKGYYFHKLCVKNEEKKWNKRFDRGFKVADALITLFSGWHS